MAGQHVYREWFGYEIDFLSTCMSAHHCSDSCTWLPKRLPWCFFDETEYIWNMLRSTIATIASVTKYTQRNNICTRCFITRLHATFRHSTSRAQQKRTHTLTQTRDAFSVKLCTWNWFFYHSPFHFIVRIEFQTNIKSFVRNCCRTPTANIFSQLFWFLSHSLCPLPPHPSPPFVVVRHHRKIPSNDRAHTGDHTRWTIPVKSRLNHFRLKYQLLWAPCVCVVACG